MVVENVTAAGATGVVAGLPAGEPVVSCADTFSDSARLLATVSVNSATAATAATAAG
jgi:hypothetical protein